MQKTIVAQKSFALQSFHVEKVEDYDYLLTIYLLPF